MQDLRKFYKTAQIVAVLYKKNVIFLTSHRYAFSKEIFYLYMVSTNQWNIFLIILDMISNNSKDNKTSIQWTPGSQVYLSKKKNIFGQK